MTALSSDAVTVADARQASTSLRRLRLCVLLVSLPFGMLVFGLPLIAREMGASALIIGGLLSISALIIVAIQPIVGLGLDRFGRRSFLIVGLMGYTLSSAIFGLSSGIAGLFLAQIAQGIGAGLFWLAALAIISDLAPEAARGLEYGRVEEMSFRGILVGSLASFALLYLLSHAAFGGGLSLTAAWRILFFGFTAAALFAAILVWRGVPESLQRSAENLREISGISTDQLGKKMPSENLVKKRLFSRQLLIFLGIVILTASAGTITSPILIKYLNDNFSTTLFSVALTFLPAALAGAVLPSRLGGLSDRIGRRPPLIGAFLIAGVAALAIPFVQSLWPLALLWTLEAAAFAAALPAEEALVVDLSDGGRLGVTLGFFTAAAGLGGVIGPLLGGWLFDRFVALSVFVVAALLFALGAVLILLLVGEPAHNK